MAGLLTRVTGTASLRTFFSIAALVRIGAADGTPLSISADAALLTASIQTTGRAVFGFTIGTNVGVGAKAWLAPSAPHAATLAGSVSVSSAGGLLQDVVDAEVRVFAVAEF